MSSISNEGAGRLFLAEQRIFEIEKELRLINSKHNDLAQAIQNMNASLDTKFTSIENKFAENNRHILTYIDSKFEDLYTRLFPQPPVLAQV